MPDPTVAKIIEAAYGSTSTLERTGTDVSLEIHISEELDSRPPCESGAAHQANTLGHRAEERAAFWVIPGCGHDKMLCASWVAAARASTAACFQCSVCSQRTDLGSMVYIPLDT